METVHSLTMREGRPAIWTERRSGLCEACSQRDVAAYTRLRSRESVEVRTCSRRPRPVSPSKPAKPSKPHKPVRSRSARGSTSRVSGGRVSGGGTGVWANGVATGSSNKLDASRLVPTQVEHFVFVMFLTLCRAFALGDHGSYPSCHTLCKRRAMVIRAMRSFSSKSIGVENMAQVRIT